MCVCVCTWCIYKYIHKYKLFLDNAILAIFTPAFSNRFRVAFNDVLNIRENACRVLFGSPNKIIQVYLVKVILLRPPFYSDSTKIALSSLLLFGMKRRWNGTYAYLVIRDTQSFLLDVFFSSHLACKNYIIFHTRNVERSYNHTCRHVTPLM